MLRTCRTAPYSRVPRHPTPAVVLLVVLHYFVWSILQFDSFFDTFSRSSPSSRTVVFGRTSGRLSTCTEQYLTVRSVRFVVAGSLQLLQPGGDQPQRDSRFVQAGHRPDFLVLKLHNRGAGQDFGREAVEQHFGEWNLTEKNAERLLTLEPWPWIDFAFGCTW